MRVKLRVFTTFKPGTHYITNTVGEDLISTCIL